MVVGGGGGGGGVGVMGSVGRGGVGASAWRMQSFHGNNFSDRRILVVKFTGDEGGGGAVGRGSGEG